MSLLPGAIHVRGHVRIDYRSVLFRSVLVHQGEISTAMNRTPPRTLLLVDDEPNILTSLQRVLRRDGYRIMACDDPFKALDVLAEDRVDVILADQRMPGMSGVEFLRRAKTLHPETVRIVLSGYIDLQFITDAINEGAIYKFLTKPWDDEQLREQVREAFRSKEVTDENRRLTLALQAANGELQAHVDEQVRQARQIETVLDTLQEVLQLIPWPIVGIDEEGMVALSNSAADVRLGGNEPLLGQDADAILPPFLRTWLQTPEAIPERLLHEGRDYRVIYKPMGQHSRSRGTLLALLPCEICK